MASLGRCGLTPQAAQALTDEGINSTGVLATTTRMLLKTTFKTIESTLKKKHLSICYHLVREAAAAQILRVAWEDGKTMLADVLTKLMAGTSKRDKIEMMLY